MCLGAEDKMIAEVYDASIMSFSDFDSYLPLTEKCTKIKISAR